jgi:hypothetical protein
LISIVHQLQQIIENFPGTISIFNSFLQKKINLFIFQDERIVFIIHIGHINVIILAYFKYTHTWTTNVDEREINGITICVNETCQLLYMNQLNK